jgi:hypothetical protein
MSQELQCPRRLHQPGHHKDELQNYAYQKYGTKTTHILVHYFKTYSTASIIGMSIIRTFNNLNIKHPNCQLSEHQASEPSIIWISSTWTINYLNFKHPNHQSSEPQASELSTIWTSSIQTINYLSVKHPDHQFSEPLPVKKLPCSFQLLVTILQHYTNYCCRDGSTQARFKWRQRWQRHIISRDSKVFWVS